MKLWLPLFLLRRVAGCLAVALADELGTSEKRLVEPICAEKPPAGADLRFIAAVRRIDEARGQLEFNPQGELVGVDLSSGRVSVTDADVELLPSLPHLQKLRLSGEGITGAGLARLRLMPGLVELALQNTQIDDEGLRR